MLEGIFWFLFYQLSVLCQISVHQVDSLLILFPAAVLGRLICCLWPSNKFQYQMWGCSVPRWTLYYLLHGRLGHLPIYGLMFKSFSIYGTCNELNPFCLTMSIVGQGVGRKFHAGGVFDKAWWSATRGTGAPTGTDGSGRRSRVVSQYFNWYSCGDLEIVWWFRLEIGSNRWSKVNC